MESFIIRFYGCFKFCLERGDRFERKENEVKDLTLIPLPLSFMRMKFDLYHNRQVLDESHVFDVVMFLHV